jgi:hypothetical protein
MGQSCEPHGLFGELLAEQTEDSPVDFIQSVLVDPEERQGLTRNVIIDNLMTLHRGEVANPT